MGIVYSMIALGFSVVWAAMGIINVAHAALMVLSSYLTFVLFWTQKMDPLISIVLVAPFVSLIGCIPTNL